MSGDPLGTSHPRSRRAGGSLRSQLAAVVLGLVALGLSACTPAGVWTWGANSAGQLGDGTLNDRAAPVAVDVDW